MDKVQAALKRHAEDTFENPSAVIIKVFRLH